MKFSTLIVIFVSAAISGVAATLVAVERDVAELTTDTKNLENLVRAFPTKGGTISQALAIRSATTKVSATFDKATADLNTTPHLNDADGARMYNAAKTPTELLIQTLNLLVVKKPAFESIVIGIGPAVVGMLRTLGASADKFGDKLITLDPASIKPAALELKSKAEVAFKNAIVAYSK